MKESEKLNLIEVGKRVREVREAIHLSGAALGDAIGYSQNAISKIERGLTAKVNLDAIKAIAKVCGCTEDYLLLKTDFKTRQEAVQAVVGQMQNLDVMWTEFLRHVALIAGYTMQEVDRSSVSPADVHSPYLRFVKDGDAKSLSMREVNVFISEVEQHSGLALQMLFDRKKGR